jgi:hypothetical protein
MCEYTAGGLTSDQVTVTVRYGYPIFFPLLSFATDAVDGTSDNAWTLSATAEMRLEHNLTSTPVQPCLS